ncbi:MAG: Hsp20/alpha crystallin family protein [Anaerolineales bacterium]|nr:Hsp20/alpha crystallin family protein [Anaerolineales bacterium]
MSNLTRWEPMREMITLREAMDRLFNDAFTRPLSMSGVSGLPAIDMYQTKEDVVVKATLPGLKAEDVDISITGEQLTLRGEVKQESEQKDKNYHIREQSYGSFERLVLLPTDVKADKAKAEFEDGILTITMPIAEDVKPKSISIKAQ